MIKWFGTVLQARDFSSPLVTVVYNIHLFWHSAGVVHIVVKVKGTFALIGAVMVAV